MEVVIAIAVVLVLTVLIRVLTGRGERSATTLPTTAMDPSARRSMNRSAAGLGSDAGPDAGEIAALVDRGRKIQAIKLYRDRHGVGLREAMEAVERLARERRHARRG